MTTFKNTEPLKLLFNDENKKETFEFKNTLTNDQYILCCNKVHTSNYNRLTGSYKKKKKQIIN